MISRIIVLLFALAALAVARAKGAALPPIPNKQIVIIVDFWEYSEEDNAKRGLGSIIVDDVGTSWIHMDPKDGWRKIGVLTEAQIGEYRSLVISPKSLKAFASKNDRRWFSLNMDNHHVQFPEPIRTLYRLLLGNQMNPRANH